MTSFNGSETAGPQEITLPRNHGSADMLAAALDQASDAWGFHVFPIHTISAGRCSCGRPDCKNAGKHPFGRLAKHGFKDATRDANKIREWWKERPDANIGIATGKVSNLVVLDVDIKPEKDGSQLLKMIESKYGPLPSTVAVQTGSGGKHLFFKYPDGLQRMQSIEYGGLDIRADGGYVVAPPSLHRSGNRYEIMKQGPISQLPLWLLDYARDPQGFVKSLDQAETILHASSAPGKANEYLQSITRSAIAGGVGAAVFSTEEVERLCSALSFVSSDDYLVWRNVGFGLKWLAKQGWPEELCRSVFDAWARTTNRDNYKEGSQEGLWRASSRDEAKPIITVASIFHLAIQRGWDASAPPPAGDWARPISKISGLAGTANLETDDLAATEQIAKSEEPRLLRRQISPARPFPINALGEVLGDAVRAIVDKTQCPDAIAANSVLGAASMAVQAHADVLIPATRRAKPVSLFLATVAGSGERKSEADHEALWPLRKRAETLRFIHEVEIEHFRRAHRAWKIAVERAEKENKSKGREALEAALKAVGEEPQPPLSPILTCDEPTFEGLRQLYMNGHPSLGLFSDEGGSFVNSHAMREENRLRTVSGFSKLWDGKPLDRIRADGAGVLPGRRLALHLMMQPNVSARMLSDETLADQGFLSRLLCAAPASTVGTRFQKGLKPETEAGLKRYGARLLSILEAPVVMMPKARNALDPRQLAFREAADKRWREYADEVEGRLGPGKEFEPIRGFANKLPEHAARIAAVLTLVEDLHALAIDTETLERAIAIAEFFASEALRLFEASACPPEIRQAEKLLKWLHEVWHEDLIGLSVIYQLGPASIRDADTAKKAVALLESHGWLVKESGSARVSGKSVRHAWRIVKTDDAAKP